MIFTAGQVDFSTDGRELTPTMKMARHAVLKKFAAEVSSKSSKSWRLLMRGVWGYNFVSQMGCRQTKNCTLGLYHVKPMHNISSKHISVHWNVMSGSVLAWIQMYHFYLPFPGPKRSIVLSEIYSKLAKPSIQIAGAKTLNTTQVEEMYSGEFHSGGLYSSITLWHSHYCDAQIKLGGKWLYKMWIKEKDSHICTSPI